MADCSYARCVQERRFIRRELSKWTKGMVYIVGLERVAEELMGRRKWKLYQEVIARSNQNITDSTNFTHQQPSLIVNQINNSFQQNSIQEQQDQQQQQQQTQELPLLLKNSIQEEEKSYLSQKNSEKHLKENNIATIKCKSLDSKIETESGLTTSTAGNQENLPLDHETLKELVKLESNAQEKLKASSIYSNNNITTHGSSDSNFIEDSKEKLEDEENIRNQNKKLSDIELSPRTITATTAEEEEEVVQPIDWKPQDSCYFCVDGKLLTVNDKGELVAESGLSAQPEADIANQSPHESDSESSESCSEVEIRNSQKQKIIPQLSTSSSVSANQTLESILRGTLPRNMTSLETMAATIQAVATIQGLQNVPGLSSIYSGLFYPHLSQQLPHTQATDNLANISGVNKTPSSSPCEAVSSNAEQPLDLSAKSSAPQFPLNDTKSVLHSISRAKPRVSTVPGRRTYTEEELQLALHDIISGKLGTRRAAVLYGIPRSTLRNKVYKLAMEQKREALMIPQPPLVVPDEEDKEISDNDDDNKDSGKMSTPTISSVSNYHNKEIDTNRPQSSSTPTGGGGGGSSSGGGQQTASSSTPPLASQNPWLEQSLMLQSLILSGGLNALPGLMPQKSEDIAALPEFLRNLLLNAELLRNPGEREHNGKPNTNDTKSFASHLQEQQQQQQQLSRLNIKSETPETLSSADANESDDTVILKIPSFNPTSAGSSSSSSITATASKSNINNNQENQMSSSALQHLQQQHQHQQQHNNSLPNALNSPPLHSGLSPTLKRQRSDSQSPPPIPFPLSIHEVIANSINKSFQQQQHQHQHQQLSPDMLKHHSPDSMEHYKRQPQISVIKSLGGSDMARFGGSPNMMHSPLNNSLTGTGGKGTRPKRGKYRNYDRDSLVEAVKAVQRGEMSVHRAGSYYGVPHSTLEYKVKERHLMRPRKREPKPQPLDDRTSTTSTSSSSLVNSSKNQDLTGSGNTLRTMDKSKNMQSTKSPLKTPPFPSTSPSNGLKMPMFDPTMAAQLQYPSPLFWPHPAHTFPGLGMDFQRPPSSGTPQFQSEQQFIASQMIQRFQEESTRSQLKSPSLSNNNQIKTPRELVESLYDNNSANGSLLDGIIRQSLDRGKNNDITHGAILDQLIKTKRSNSLNDDELNLSKSSTSSLLTKRSAGSPLRFDIKKERSSPLSSNTDDTDRDSPESHNYTNQEHVENLIKFRDNLATLRNDDIHQQQQQHQQLLHNRNEEINGKSTSSALHINNQSDNDDSS